MTERPAEPLIEPLANAAYWSLLRHRCGFGADRALVFLTDEGTGRVEPPRGDDGAQGYARPTLGDVRRGEFAYACSVSLTERTCEVDVAESGGAHGERPGSLRHPAHRMTRYQVAWQVDDPVAAARTRLTEAGAAHWIARDIEGHGAVPARYDLLKQPPPPYGTTPIEPYGQQYLIEAAGLSYRFLDALPQDRPAAPPGAGLAAALPVAWGDAHREAYGFYREVVAGGPVGLAALWLLHQPEQAREVLDWTVSHRELLTDRDGWERTLAATLQGLTEEERSFVGVGIAQVLRDIGLPQGEEVLHRLRGGGVNGAGGANGVGGPQPGAF